MKMDGLDSAKCQNWEKKDINVIFEILNEENDKIMHSVLLLKQKRPKRAREGKGLSVGWNLIFLERESLASL